MSLATLKTKVEQLVEIAQNGGSSGGGSSEVYDPEARPGWWLPRPTVTAGDDINEVWALIEVLPDITEYDGEDISNAEIVANGYKQFWKRVSLTPSSNYVICPDFPDAVELIVNCSAYFILSRTAGTSVYYNNNAMKTLDSFGKLQFISGTDITVNSFNAGTFCGISGLRKIENQIIIRVSSNNSSTYSLFGATSLIKTPKYISKASSKISLYNVFINCRSLVEATLDSINFTNNSLAYCFALRKVHISNDSATSVSTFTNCTNIEKVTIEDGRTYALYIHHSEKYSQAVLHDIAEKLADMSGSETAPVFQLGTTNWEKMDEEHQNMVLSKGWAQK